MSIPNLRIFRIELSEIKATNINKLCNKIITESSPNLEKWLSKHKRHFILNRYKEKRMFP